MCRVDPQMSAIGVVWEGTLAETAGCQGLEVMEEAGLQLVDALLDTVAQDQGLAAEVHADLVSSLVLAYVVYSWEDFSNSTYDFVAVTNIYFFAGSRRRSRSPRRSRTPRRSRSKSPRKSSVSPRRSGSKSPRRSPSPKRSPQGSPRKSRSRSPRSRSR